MEEEAFDRQLKSLVLKHDQQHKPAFDRGRVFAGSRKKKGFNPWYVAAAMTFLTGAACFFMLRTGEDLPVKGVKIAGRRAHEATTVKTVPEVVKVDAVNPGVNIVFSKKVVTPIELKLTEKTHEIPINDTVVLKEHPANKLIVNNLPSNSTASHTETSLTADDDVEISFKRGKAPDLETTLSLKPTTKLKFGFKKMRTSDSSSYAEVKNIKFKF